MTTSDQVIVKLLLEGKRAEAQELAHSYVELFREDPNTGPIPVDTGACHFCGTVFEEHDCQHEIGNRIGCDGCYLALGGR